MTSIAAAVVLVVVIIIVGSFLLVVAWKKRAHGYDGFKQDFALILLRQFLPTGFLKEYMK